MVNLSVNINKIATLRNARGADVPNVQSVAVDCERFGANGITVHPRPDQRHIRYDDLFSLRPLVKTEFNIEGYPSEEFINLVLKVKPEQVTLVPDAPDALTSNAGWDVAKNLGFLSQVVERFKNVGIRTSIFVSTDIENIKYAAKAGTDRIELYTEPYAAEFEKNPEMAVEPFVAAAAAAFKLGLGVNAGHDLNLKNLRFFKKSVKHLSEVSIGHALIADALYMGLEDTLKAYLEAVK